MHFYDLPSITLNSSWEFEQLLDCHFSRTFFLRRMLALPQGIWARCLPRLRQHRTERYRKRASSLVLPNPSSETVHGVH